MPDRRGHTSEQNSDDNNWNPEQEKAGDHEKCNACDQAQGQQAEDDRRRARLRDDNMSHAIMIIDAQADSSRLLPGTPIKARRDDLGLRAGLFWRSIAHRHDSMWVVQR